MIEVPSSAHADPVTHTKATRTAGVRNSGMRVSPPETGDRLFGRRKRRQRRPSVAAEKSAAIKPDALPAKRLAAQLYRAIHACRIVR
jgi:hypothetical protein